MFVMVQRFEWIICWLWGWGPRSFNLPPTAPMGGGTQLFEEAHFRIMTNTLNWQRWQMCPLNPICLSICWNMWKEEINKEGKVWVLYYCSMLTFAQFIRNLRTFVVKSALSRLRTFWEALLAKIWWGEAQKHFKGPGYTVTPSSTSAYQYFYKR